MKVSSTKVREALQKGDVHLANDLLGYAYSLSGIVVKGDQLGRTLGYPTANVATVDPFKLVPANGVYAVNVTLKDGVYQGMMSIGVRPTVVEAGERTIEVNLFNFERDIYGEPITVRVRHRMRDEIRFDGLDALKAQMAKDKIEAQRLLNA